MKKTSLFLIVSTSILFSSEMKVSERFSIDPFKYKSKINFSFNDISNYPKGIFDISKKYKK